MFLFFISSFNFSGMPLHLQCFLCSRCHSILCSTLGFFGILFFLCHSAFSSYIIITKRMGLKRFELLTSRLSAGCSNQPKLQARWNHVLLFSYKKVILNITFLFTYLFRIVESKPIRSEKWSCNKSSFKKR